MAKGIYIRTEKNKQNLSKAWNYDKHFTKDCRNKISIANKGLKRSEESKKNMRKPKSVTHKAWNKGLTMKNDLRVLNYINTRKNLGKYKHSEESRMKMSISKKGIKAWNKNKKIPQITGKNHPNWKGGKSFEPYDSDFSEIFKNNIRNRDENTCMLCLKDRQELKRRLDVHHINYDKKCSLAQNCISLCRSCHELTNNNRQEWTKFFQSILSDTYGYIYEEDGTIKLNFQTLEV